jgi:hypothetical protein
MVAMLMDSVPILLVRSSVHATLDTVVMDSTVPILTNAI